jgi:phosphoglycolate phosphatase-like HAD superfamily hydrolase
MSDIQAPLKNMEKKHDFLVAIDSDGCAFDSMEIKHKECFIPNIVKYWNLQPVSKYTRAAAEFVNLYSKWRGINRFPALTMVFDLLADWPDVQRRHAEIPVAQPVRDWIARETKLGNPALKVEVQKTGDPVLKQALEWSEAVNAAIADMVHDVPPFPFVRESLEKISGWADILVCSATPGEALVREWEEHGIAEHAAVIAGQEMGSKKEHIHLASDGKYDKSRILMIGDAPGDMKAARGNGAMFFPINPGSEDTSWELFFCEAADKFRNGQYTAEYEGKLIAEFDKLLPEIPAWKHK